MGSEANEATETKWNDDGGALVIMMMVMLW